jgi:hypothetical protein
MNKNSLEFSIKIFDWANWIFFILGIIVLIIPFINPVAAKQVFTNYFNTPNAVLLFFLTITALLFGASYVMKYNKYKLMYQELRKVIP